MRALLGLVLFVFSVGAGAQADSYLCVADQATGFDFNKVTKKWKATNFNITDEKYIVARSKDEGFTWAVTKVGENVATTYCEDDMRGDSRYLTCEAGYPNFYFSAKSLRFTRNGVAGFVLPSGEWYSEGDVKPFLEIGKCSPL